MNHEKVSLKWLNDNRMRIINQQRQKGVPEELVVERDRQIWNQMKTVHQLQKIEQGKKR